MLILDYSVNLDYEYFDKENYQRKIEYIFEDYIYRDNVKGVDIIVKQGFALDIRGIVAENQEIGFSYACKLVNTVCKVLTILLQFKNYDNRENSPNLIFWPHKMKLKSKQEVKEQNVVKKGDVKILRDEVRIHDELAGIHITEEFDFGLFEDIYSKMEKSELMLASETIYRAVLSKNVESRFFQLFTIIEEIETKHGSDDDIGHKILQEEELKRFEEKLKVNINELDIDDTYRTRLNSRLLQILRGATIETRAEKLADIIAKKYNIAEIKKGMIRYQINSQKMKEFIEIRNKLFHGNHTNGDNYNMLVQKTNELQELCLEIVKQ